MLRYHTLVLCGFLAFMGMSHARSAIEVQVTQGATTETVGFTSIEDAINSWETLEDTYGDTFNDNLDFTGTLDVLGFGVTVGFEASNPDGLSELTYSFTDSDGVLHSHSFTGTTKDDAINQFEDFFDSELGESELNALLASLQTASDINLVSGTLSMMGESIISNAYRSLGQSYTATEIERADLETGGWGIVAETSEFEVSDFTGNVTSISVSFDNRLSRYLSFGSRIPIRHTDIEGSQVFGMGFELDLGIRPLATDLSHAFDWEITPTVGNALTASEDLAIAADIFSYGIRNRFQANIKFFSISYGFYYGQHESYDIEQEDYTIDLDVNMGVTSHGLKTAFRIGQNVVVDGFYIKSNSDDDERFDEVTTLGTSVGVRLSLVVLQLGYAVDETNDEVNPLKNDRYFGRLMMRF